MTPAKKKKKVRSKFLSVLSVFFIIAGILASLLSFPFFTIQNSMERGGVLMPDRASVDEVKRNSPADISGFKQNDLILSVESKDVRSTDEVIEMTNARKGSPTQILVQRDGTIHAINVTPRLDPPAGEGRLGLTLIGTTKIEYMPAHQALPYIIFRHYTGHPDLVGRDYILRDGLYETAHQLISGLLTIVLGVGIWRLRSWVPKVYLLVVGMSLFLSILIWLFPERSMSVQLDTYLNGARPLPGMIRLITEVGTLAIQYAIVIYIYLRLKRDIK